MVKEEDLRNTLLSMTKHQLCTIRNAFGYSSECTDKSQAADNIIYVIKRCEREYIKHNIEK